MTLKMAHNCNRENYSGQQVDTGDETAWAQTVVRLLGQEETKQSIRWWKGKQAKAMYGTATCKRCREALRQALDVVLE